MQRYESPEVHGFQSMNDHSDVALHWPIDTLSHGAEHNDDPDSRIDDFDGTFCWLIEQREEGDNAR